VGSARRGLVTALNRANWALCQASTARASVVCCAYIRSQQPSPLTAHSSQQPWPVHGVQVPINQAQRLANQPVTSEAVSTEAPADGSRFSTRTRRRPRKKRQPPPSPLSNSKQVSKYLAGAASGFVSCRPGFYYVLPLAWSQHNTSGPGVLPC
jgi:hypothetical protein